MGCHWIWPCQRVIGHAITANDTWLSILTGHLMKHSRPWTHLGEINLPAFHQNLKLCPIDCINVYIKRTAGIRGDIKTLFITTKKPYVPPARDTLSRWIKSILILAGVNMNIFTPQSVRGASTSKAVGHVPLDTIMSTGGWTRETTFSKFYEKPVVQIAKFGNALLSTYANWSS